MNIALCDDERVYMDRESEWVKRAVTEMGVQADIYEFESAGALMESEKRFDAAFLDIETGEDSGISGFEAARHLKAQNPSCVTAFVTNHARYMKKGYEVRAFRYILKDEPEMLIHRQLCEVIKEAQRKNKYISGKHKGETFMIAISELCYVESYRHMVIYHCMGGKVYQEYRSFQTVEEELLGYGFVKCHRSYLVNTDNIRGIRENRLMLSGADAESLPIGISHRDKLWEVYMNMYMEGGQ